MKFDKYECYHEDKYANNNNDGKNNRKPETKR